MKADGLYAGHGNIWSDWALHISIANIFAFKSIRYWFSYHPLYAGGKFTYPFLADLVSGMLMRAGISLEQSFALPSIILTLSLLTGLYFLFYLLTSSRKAALTAVFIFFLSAGLGFISFLNDLILHPSLSSLLYPLRDYGRFENYQWGASNMAVGLLVPQRAFLAGVTMGAWSIVGVLYVILKDKDLAPGIKTKILIMSGVLAGILPVTHPHSFMALIAITGSLCLFNLKKWRTLWPYVLVAGTISSVLYLTFIYGGIESASFVQWHPGYTANGDLFDWLRMWILIWGIMLPLALGSLYYFRKNIDRSRWAVYFGAFMLFAVGNLFYLQPIAWDNSKIFWWVYLILSAPASLALVHIWSKRGLLFRSAAVLLFITLIFMGVIELSRLIQVDQHDYLMTGTEDIKLGLEIREKTGPLDIFLTAPAHNHFVMMWGLRPILMGYTAWLWNYGFDYHSREMDMRKMFLGLSGTEDLLQKYRISYVAIGPAEIHDLDANENYFRGNFPVAFRDSSYRIYDTRSVWQNEGAR